MRCDGMEEDECGGPRNKLLILRQRVMMSLLSQCCHPNVLIRNPVPAIYTPALCWTLLVSFISSTAPPCSPGTP